MEAMRTLYVFALAAVASLAADNTLAPQEKREGWTLLFDGKSMTGWRPTLDAWEVSEGCLKTRLKPRIEEDLLTAKEYGDFEMKFDWKISQRGNTGLKYRIQRNIFVERAKEQKGPGGFEGMLGREISNPVSDRSKLADGAQGWVYTVGFEFQLLDDEQHPDAKREAHRTGALYSMIPAAAKAAKPAGEWNSSVLVVKGPRFEHWINGTKVLEGTLEDPRVKEGVEKRWGKWAPAIVDALTKPKPRGFISLQHHGDEVWFKNLKIRER